MGGRLTSESWLSKPGASQQCARGTQNHRTIHSNHFIQTQGVRCFYVRTRGCSKNNKANTQNTIKNNTAETNPVSPLEATAWPAPPREPGEPGQGTFTQEPAWPGPPREVGSWAETSATWRRLLETGTWAGVALDRQGLEKQMRLPQRRSQPLKKPSAGAPRVQGDLARGPCEKLNRRDALHLLKSLQLLATPLADADPRDQPRGRGSRVFTDPHQPVHELRESGRGNSTRSTPRLARRRQPSSAHTWREQGPCPAWSVLPHEPRVPGHHSLAPRRWTCESGTSTCSEPCSL